MPSPLPPQQQELRNKSLLSIYRTKAMTEQVTAVLPNWVSQDENISRGAKIFLRYSFKWHTHDWEYKSILR